MDTADASQRPNRDRPRILLIPNVGWWIIAEIGQQLIQRFSDRYDFYLIPETVFWWRTELIRAILPYMDVVHCMNETSASLVRYVPEIQRPPVVSWIHHVTEWTLQHQAAVDLSDCIITCTAAWKQVVAGHSPSSNVQIVPLGVDCDMFRHRDRNRRRFGLPEQGFVVGFVGSKGSDKDNSRKGTDTFLSAVKAVGAETPDLHVVFVGPGWDEELEKLQTAGVRSSTTGYLRRSELPHAYSQMDAYMMTSRVEGGPCTVLEAMACETPVVATRVGFVPEIVIHGLNGYMSDVDDIAGLASAVLALAKNRDRVPQVGRAARQAALRRTWRETLTPLGQLYDVVQTAKGTRICCSEPGWLHNSRRVSRVARAADILTCVVPQVRSRKTSWLRFWRAIRDLDEGLNAFDFIRGAAMIKGLIFRNS